ncbi:MAG: FG-GAP-like repeat-containing protein [Planctomycetota bacterium]
MLAPAAIAGSDDCPSFPAAAAYAAGTGPQGVAIGDLDGDGDGDLAVANNGGDVSILLNVGDGTFAEATAYATGALSHSVAIGDLDGDGDGDLAVANAGSNDVSIHLNAGDGTFAAAVAYAAGGTSVSVAIGDLDGDGDGDLAVANSSGGTNVSVFLNAGDGTFAAAAGYATGTSPQSVAIGDLDGDGDRDLATANFGSNDVSVLLNAGDATFAAAVAYAAGEQPNSVAIGDLDGDGDRDLAVANRLSDDASVLLNAGDGTFAAATAYAAGDVPFSVAIGDLDGDGDGDLVVANFSSNDVSVLLNAGDATFAASVAYAAGNSPHSVSIGDLDGDGNSDLAVANQSGGSVSVLLNACLPPPPPGFEQPAEFPAEGAPLIHAVGDLDTALATMGTLDVAVVIPDADPSVNGQVQIFLNLGNDMGGNWLGLDPQLPTITVGPDPSGIAIGNFSLDDYADLAVTNRFDSTVSFFINNADDTGTFMAGPVVGGTFDMPSAIVAGEFGAGAGLDFAVANEGDSTVDIIGNPLTPIASVNVGSNPVALDVRDLDDDRDLDLVSANIGGDSITAILNEGGGVFTAQTDVPVGLDPVDLAIGDLNLDGNPDVITANFADGTVTILLNLGPPDGSGLVFAAPITLNAGTQPTSVDAVDYDSDNDLDLVVAGEDPIAGPALLLIENEIIPSGFLTFADPQPIVIGADPQYVLNGDFNDDGPPDLVTVNIDDDQKTGGSVTVLINEIFPCPGDFNEDGAVGFGDILALIGLWGPCGVGITCPGDLNFDGAVGFGDILFVIANWGPCQER